jgi:glycerophosphoryl diester phosphodiesterase
MRPLIALLVTLMPPVQSAPLVVAHRGASGDAPENTLPAFELAWTQRADAIEGDFHLTRDRQIVCLHDADTEKTAGRLLVVAESSLAELRALEVGSWKDAKFAGTRIPTLAEVCATVPDGRRFYIEIKCGPEIVPVLLEVLAASKLRDEQIVVISFHPEVIRAVKEQRPQWNANWLVAFDKKLDNDPEARFPEVLRTLKDIKADGLGSNAHQGIQQAHLDQLRQAGLDHHVWTVNDEETARRFLEMGTRSITTDFPARIRRLLDAD